ncbi:hypothetical protein D3C73_939510 [compost metagenome]
MVLHRSNYNFISTFNRRRPVGRSYQIKCSRRSPSENNFLRIYCPNKLGYFLTRSFISIRCPAAKRMNTAMNIGVIEFIIVFEGIQYNKRFLGCRCTIEINERMPIYLLIQYRKLFLDQFRVHCPNFLSTSPCNCSCNCSSGMSDTTGARNP